MKYKLLLISICLPAAMLLKAQNYQPVDSLSSIQFSIKNFGINTEGILNGLKGSIRFNASDLKNASFAVAINPASVNTKNSARDNHLRKAEYLDVKQYPDIKFVSTQVSPSGQPNEYTMHGILTIKGISKELVILFKATVQPDGIWFTGNSKMNRRDFGVGSGSMVLADNMLITMRVFAKKTI